MSDEWEFDLNFDLDEVELYYKCCRAKDKLIPFDKMVYSETANAEAHLNRMNDLDDGTEKTYRAELYRRSKARADKWQTCFSSD